MRKLSVRERVLLLLLAVLAAVSGYVLLFYLPAAQRLETLSAQLAQAQKLADQLDARLASQRQMERELEQLSARGDPAPYMPAYDNLQAVMVELHAILADCQEYSLSFQGEQGEDHIFCRRVSVPFVCDSYEQARAVLQKLHDSSLRGLLEDVQLSQQDNGRVTGSAAIVFFEYQAAAAGETTSQGE